MLTKKHCALAAAAVAMMTTAVPTGASADSAGADDTLHVTTVDGCEVKTSWRNAETAFTFFVKKGLSKKQSAGIVGNFIAESGVNPKQLQCGGGPGRGIAQWESGHQYARWDTVPRDNMLWYRKAADQPSAWNLTPQLNFTMYELKTFSYYGYGDLKKASSVKDSTRIFMKQFERPGVEKFELRYQHARDVYQRFA